MNEELYETQGTSGFSLQGSEHHRPSPHRQSIFALLRAVLSFLTSTLLYFSNTQSPPLALQRFNPNASLRSQLEIHQPHHRTSEV